MKPQPIETAPRDYEDTPILASVLGRVWFQCVWDHVDEQWVTFNQYLETDLRRKGRDPVFRPTMWIPLPDRGDGE